MNPYKRYLNMSILVILLLCMSVACSDTTSSQVSEPVVSPDKALEPTTESSGKQSDTTSSQVSEPVVSPAKTLEPTTESSSKLDEDSKDEKHAEHEEQESVVVRDALGQEIEFHVIPERIASISPTATEMLYEAGGKAILRDRASNFPVEVQDLPDVGSAYDPSIETIISNRPDLIVIEALTQARFADIFARSGLKVVAVKAESIDDVTRYINMIGTIIGTEEIAKSSVADIEGRLSLIGADDNRSVLLLISDQDRNLYAARPESYTGLIASVLGMDNKAAGLPDSGPFPGFALMSTEAILVANPDVLVTITPAPAPAPRLSDSIRQIPPFAGLTAIRAGNVVEGDVTLFLQSPGPRIVEAVEFLKDAVSAK